MRREERVNLMIILIMSILIKHNIDSQLVKMQSLTFIGFKRAFEKFLNTEKFI